ncbi:MAG: lytic transglycosylase domain-containing protein [Proteobacteria bacterium]|nr:lytic transglycosylase domain-containing protein [Pseudomonadota bacterium]
MPSWHFCCTVFFGKRSRIPALPRTGLILRPLLVMGLSLSAVTSFVFAQDVDPELLEKLATTMAERYEGADRFDMEVWLHASEQRLARFVDNQEERLEILNRVYTEAHWQQLDPDLILAVMHVESAFDRFAISRVGAQGLMQVMPFWRLEIGRPQDILTEIDTNVRYGTAILAHYLKVAEGDLVDALARYNGSRGRLNYPERVVGRWRTVWHNKSSDELPVLQASCAIYGLEACRNQ